MTGTASSPSRPINVPETMGRLAATASAAIWAVALCIAIESSRIIG